ncbi:preprotein translocase subunit SecA [Candidatus Peribacteria bacterium]|jgi:preprotein translocase subunit SecA|nr:preprotein translocase subunit SecA [Candidatus Peribacteria bacterium]MBT4021030.1 preprotein translocase subunit SecA [Candidatus Peribacteria bacterium]MBT4240928.1 preprotein translocase subunit SecA [Candidatus Peribacteria bacterium]MBT4474571.1 preprotein translocase subunit SecA [Candidatus Peribacteria bacterium]
MSFVDALNRLLGDPAQKELKKLTPLVAKVKNRFEEAQNFSEEDIKKKTEEFCTRIKEGESLDSVMPEAFAVVIRACQLLCGTEIQVGKSQVIWNMVPFDVQILGGIILHKGSIAEMKTGEGKTLVCTMPVYLNALTGKGVHVVTVNDYLAKRDEEWMRPLYEMLGLTTDVVVHEKSAEERRAAYNSDVTYGTNNEFGFDYLRDNMAPSVDLQVQRGLNFCIVDEVDSILIDEARTPLIISQPAEESTDKYNLYSGLVSNLKPNKDYTIDEKQRLAVLTEEGIRHMEELLGIENIYTEKGFEEVHHIEQALRAHAIYKSDVDYVVREQEIIIVDEFTGRLMPGRRYGHGLHQAIEAKERVEVQRESKTLATITFQNYFRMYEKLSGMTGTAKTEEEEFEQIYGTRTYVIPTNKPTIRDDKSDAIYRTVEAKFKAAAKIIKEKHEKGQPVLAGTTSIEKSEALGALLAAENIPHEVLNAKHHEREAEIVSQAGQKGAVTIATNMAGRGTDIKLAEEVLELGGLVILGTERHEARRIDNQLRGRAGRQGDAGESQFFVSMEDDLMRLFGGDRLKSMMERMNVPDDVPLENSMVSRAIGNAQKKVEGRNFDVRKHVVQYDDVMNKHRKIMYKRRQDLMNKMSSSYKESDESNEESLHSEIVEYIEKEIGAIVVAHASDKDPEKWEIEDISKRLGALHHSLGEFSVKGFQTTEELKTSLCEATKDAYEKKCKEYDSELVEQAERVVTLRSIDTHWMNHIDTMSHLREQVAFSGYAQKDPLIEYKDKGFRLFAQLIVSIESSIVHTLLQIDFKQFAPRAMMERVKEEQKDLETNIDDIENELYETGAGSAMRNGKRPSSQGLPPGMPKTKVGRNDPCPCGSGKKYKKCHGG